eukprot:SAG31_NODE_834_length_11650_cov_7.572245_6_plen_43_part_00
MKMKRGSFFPITKKENFLDSQVLNLPVGFLPQRAGTGTAVPS